MQRLLVLLLVALCSRLAGAPAPARPNFIFILADDLGWGDLGCYGNTQLPTPYLDQLAREGALFTHFYVNGSVCSPSRSAFFTGQYPARNRIHGHFASAGQNAARGMPNFLDPQVPNLATTLKAAGYATAHVGKWHLRHDQSPGAPGPRAYGFDYVGADESPAGAAIMKEDPYYRAKSSALFVDEGLKFIRERGDKPFFLQLWMLVPHATLNPTPEQMQPFNRFSNPDLPHKSARTIYYASVADLDRQIGRFMDELKKLGLAENTVVVFSSDNGPEDIFIQNAGHSGVGSPGPFRGRKRSLYEGGVRVPFIVRWPAKIPGGRIDDTSVIAGVDLLPTLCTLAGVQAPAGHPLDGEDVSDILTAKPRARANPLLWEWRFNIAGHVASRSPQLAIRDAQWKLLLNPDRSRTELYDIVRDPMEVDNVAAQHADVVARLSDRVLGWRKTLPAGPVDAGAGEIGYPWPGAAAAKSGPGAAKGKSKKAKSAK